MSSCALQRIDQRRRCARGSRLASGRVLPRCTRDTASRTATASHPHARRLSRGSGGACGVEGGQGAPSSAAAVDPAASPAWSNPAPASWQGILPGSRRRGRSWGREVGRSTERSSVPGPPHLYFFVRRSYRGTFDEADHLARPCLTLLRERFGFFAGAAAVAGDVRRGLREFPAPFSSASAGWTRTSCCSSARERRPGPGQAKSATSARRRRHRDAKVVSSRVPHTALGFLVASQRGS